MSCVTPILRIQHSARMGGGRAPKLITFFYAHHSTAQNLFSIRVKDVHIGPTVTSSTHQEPKQTE